MSMPAQNTARLQGGTDSWAPLLIGIFSACVAVLLVSEPSFIVPGLFAWLMLAAFVQTDFCVYASVLLLPWVPLVDLNLPIRDASLVLHFVLFAGVGVKVMSQGRSVREWLFGSRLKKAILVFAGIATVSFFRSELHPTLDSSRPLVLLISYIAVFFAIDGWLKNEAQLVNLLKLLFIATIVVALFGFYQAAQDSYTDLYFMIYPLEKESIVLVPWNGRINSLLLGYNSLAGYLILVIPSSIACAFLAKDRLLRFLGIICTISAIPALFLTQSRGGLMGLAGIVVLFVWFLVPRRTTRITIIAAGALACILLFASLSVFARFHGIQHDPDALERLPIWTAAVLLFVAHPVLGIGYGNFRLLYTDIVPGAVPGRLDAHSIYFQLLAETGIVGFISFFVLLWFVVSPALKSGRAQNALSRIIALGVLGAVAGTLVHGTVDFLFRVSPQFGTLFWVLLGISARASTGNAGKALSAASLAVSPIQEIDGL